jgi:hypothetical protein
MSQPDVTKSPRRGTRSNKEGGNRLLRGMST